jgi:hypothetical protein
VAVKTVAPDQPRTLMKAHEELVRVRPDRGASLAVWLEYYQRSVSLYEQIARIDPGHDGEALYWAQRERRRVDRVAAQLGKGGSR